MFKVIEGRITAAEESNSLEVRTKVKVDLLHPGTDWSEGEQRMAGGGYWYHAGHSNVVFHFPPATLGEIYLLTPQMLDELVEMDWELQALKEELGGDRVKELLEERHNKEEQVVEQTA